MHLLRKRIPHPDSPGIYQYHEGRVFFPGPPSYVFEPRFSLPLTTIIGCATAAGCPPSPYQSVQVYQSLTTTTAGIGGLLAGQIAMQPLLVPDAG